MPPHLELLGLFDVVKAMNQAHDTDSIPPGGVLEWWSNGVMGGPKPSTPILHHSMFPLQLQRGRREQFFELELILRQPLLM
jgi:hypothetical protein